MALDEPGQALDRLEEAYQRRDPHLTWLKVEPAFTSLRGQARFEDLLRKIGFPR